MVQFWTLYYFYKQCFFSRADGSQFGFLLGQLLQVTWLQPALPMSSNSTLTNSGFLVWLAAVPAPLSHGPVPCHIDIKHRRLGQIKTPEPICRALRSFLLCPILDSLLLLQTVVFPQADGGQFGSLLGQLLQVTWLQPAVDFEGLFWRSSGHFWRK